MKMQGNTILLTGGGSGIGRGLAEAFHALGNQVIITGRSGERLRAVTEANPGMQSLTADISEITSIQALTDTVRRDFPQVNVLINNAGIMQNENLNLPPTAAIQQTIATNLTGPLYLTSSLLPVLRANADPVVMTVSSGLAFVPLAMTPTYCATKAGIHSYTQSLRYQLKDTTVQVLEIIPPYVATTLQGERQANDPAAMPLDDFIRETISLLSQNPTPPEICVQRVGHLRNAADGGAERYSQVFSGLNDHMSSSRAAEMPQPVS